MVIVYLSIALGIIALVYLGVSAFRTFKAIKSPLESLSQTAANLQEKMEGIKKETDHLKQKTGEFQHDLQERKLAVKNVITNVKWSGEEIKSLWRWARTVPNPKKMDPVPLSPEVERITSRIINILEKWQKLRN